jgi:N-acetylmuramoyl-L-alanine amidase
VLIETAYISNPEEERRLDSNDYRERLARAILAGTRSYFYRNPPEGSLVASLAARPMADAIRHVVERGDSLSTLATRCGTSVQQIRSANGLRGDGLQAGRVLRIPLLRET